MFNLHRRLGKMAQIEVPATDGKMQKRILWIDVKRNGVYASCVWKIEIFVFRIIVMGMHSGL